MEATRRRLLGGGGAALALGAGGTFVAGRLVGAAGDGPPTALVAGSLLRVASRVRGASVEAHGSAAVRRLVVEGLRTPDAVALADPRLFDGIARRATLFATNALVVTYDPASPLAGALRDDWRSAVESDGIRLGRTDPRRDPLGYRTVMALELAERRYDLDARAVLDASTVFPETDLLNVVEGGGVDAAFTYRSMAVERDLPYVDLPDAIDFSDPDHAGTYASVSFDLDHATVHGSPIRYAATATTARGEPWTDRLVAARELLTESGFVVPGEYPVRNARLDFPP